ncbi:hypothetical protein PMAYCL1PPCAC_05056 [Pristionchus mayeri]|uniref:FYVE-type domain-containing protein n=1 Tax=Pristionchus mayeri TaxID=1317129 RepID=A0AAN4Z684_9BILA|nr:hypothetical protein PMAYCL1PPCAC_05056 [Pristionchus mayeri]
MAAVPDLDDLLDQLEGSVSAGATPLATGRRGFFDPVPCFSTSRANVGAPAQADSNGGRRNAAEVEEKLSFVEFLKVTAKEAEELHQLQRLHDDQQENRSSKRIGNVKREEKVAPASAAVPSPRPMAAPAPTKWDPPTLVVPEMPVFPDVPDGLPQNLLQQNGRAAETGRKEREELALADKENRLQAEFEETGRDTPSPVAHQLPRLETPSPDLGVEMGEEAEVEQRMHLPTPSPEPCLIAVDEQHVQPMQPSPQLQLQQEGAEPAAERGEEDDEFDEVLAYLAKCDGGSAAAPTADDEPAAAVAVPAASPAADDAPAAAADSAPPSPIAVTPPSCNTAASFDVVSFEALPSDAVNESEMERELQQLAEDFPDSDQPEIARNDENNGTADETFYSAVESLDRTVNEEEEGKEKADEEVKDQEEVKEEEEEDGMEAGDEDRNEEGEEEKKDREEESEREETLPEERQEIDLVFVNESAGDERVAEVEDVNREKIEMSIVVDVPPTSTEKEEKMEDDLPEEKEKEDEEDVVKGDEEKEVSPLVSPSISGGSGTSMEVVERADVEQMEQEMREEEEKADEEPVVIEEAHDPGEDTVADQQVSIDESVDTVEEVVDPTEPAVMLLEPMPEMAAIEEAGDSITEEEEGRLDEEGEEGEEIPQPCFEVSVVDRPASPATAAAAARAARFRDRVISDVHEIDGDEAPAQPSRLTESELQLGKTPPIWIPDAECPACMLCSARFTFLLRRHHCRACGRVLCSACCGERMVLAYQPDKGKARVCSPCASTLQRVEELEKEREGSPETAGGGSNATGDAADTVAAPTVEGMQPAQQLQVGLPLQGESGSGNNRKKSILKVRAASVSVEEGLSQGGAPSPALSIPGQRGGVGDESVGSVVGSAPRGVVFRDGIKPGEHTPDELAREEEERQAGGRMQPQLRKKSRKRAAVSRRVAALKVEEQLASALPTHARPELLMVQGGVRVWSSLREAELSLAEGDCVRIAVNRLITVAVQICQAPYGEGRVMCAVSHGFHSLGLDEIVFCWRLDPSSIREDDEEYGEEMGEESKRKMRADLPMAVVRRIEEILQSCFTSSDLPDVRRMAMRMPRLHTSIATESDDEPPMTRHTMLVAASHQSTRHLPLSPSLPYVFAVPIHQSELPWALAAPNRVLLRMGLASGCYPTPLIIDPSREAVYSDETSSSVLKMFNDIGTWSYRMQHVIGGTVALSNEETTIRIPRHARQQMRKIVEINRNMLAWLCDVNTEADSHLICIETEQGLGPYESNIFQKGGERKKTGATFVIIDGALKTPSARVQVSVCEDGIAVRLPSEGLVELINMLLDGKDHTIDSGTHRLRVEWMDLDEPTAGTQLISPIDGLYLGNKMQYGLTLERVISSTVASPSLPDTATRLSHVFNMRENMIPPEDEAKVFSVAELVASEAAGMVDEYLPLLTTIGVNTLALRATVERDRIEYEVAEWAGLETEQTRFRASLDKLVPVFVNVLGYIPHGFSIELWISIVSTTPLPLEI